MRGEALLSHPLLAAALVEHPGRPGVLALVVQVQESWKVDQLSYHPGTDLQGFELAQAKIYLIYLSFMKS